jgi:PAS domain S-box-containing protein
MRIMDCSTLSSRIAELYKNIDSLKHKGSDPQALNEAIDKLQISLRELSALEEGIYQENRELDHDRKHTDTERQHYQELFDQAPYGYLVTDSNGIIKEANLAASDLFKVGRETLKGRQAQSFISPDRPDIFASYLSSLSCSKRSLSFDAVARDEDDNLFPASLAVSAVMDGQCTVEELLWLVQDETELKKANEELRKRNSELQAEIHQKAEDESKLLIARDKAEAAARAKSEFLASMSHEIRTPLNAIIGMTGLLLDDAMPPEKKDYVETIRSSSDALLSIINDILDISKIDGEKMEIERQPFDIRECIETAIDLVAAEAARKGLNLAYTICQNTPECFTGDPARLRQVLVNLLGNGVKFTNSGEVTVSAWYQDKRIYFSVQDTGIGIPQDRMDRLFKSFSQVDMSTARKYGGTGLGLAISKRLVEMMGGEIWAKSAPGSGSTFNFSIRAETYSCEPKPYLSRDQPMLSGKKVLIAEMSRINRIILGHHIQSWGMMPLNAKTGQDALRMIGKNRFDLAIIDRQVLGIDGLDLAREIRRMNRALPIIMLTSIVDGGLKRDGKPASDVLVKPIKPSQLFGAIKGVFKEPHVLEEARSVKSQSSESSIRVLLAEDNPVNQKVMLKMLERLGYHADVASDGQEVLQALEREHYDIILMDIQMPKMDGLEAARAIRQRFPAEAQPRIIAITAYALAGDKERCLKAGMDGYISKPVRMEDLKELMVGASS